jgi:hypothetical protein
MENTNFQNDLNASLDIDLMYVIQGYEKCLSKMFEAGVLAHCSYHQL